MSRIRQTQDEERDDSNLVITTINSGHWFISYRKRDRELKTTWREIEGWLAEVRIETEISAAWGIWEDGSESIEGSEVVEEAVDIEIQSRLFYQSREERRRISKRIKRLNTFSWFIIRWSSWKSKSNSITSTWTIS